MGFLLQDYGEIVYRVRALHFKHNNNENALQSDLRMVYYLMAYLIKASALQNRKKQVEWKHTRLFVPLRHDDVTGIQKLVELSPLLTV